MKSGRSAREVADGFDALQRLGKCLLLNRRLVARDALRVHEYGALQS